MVTFKFIFGFQDFVEMFEAKCQRSQAVWSRDKAFEDVKRTNFRNVSMLVLKRALKHYYNGLRRD